MSNVPVSSMWRSLRFVFWVYLVGGIVLFQFVASANFYYLSEVQGNLFGPMVLWVGGQLLSALHALSALYFIWRASVRSSVLTRVASRIVAVLYLCAISIGTILWGYILLFTEFP